MTAAPLFTHIEIAEVPAHKPAIYCFTLRGDVAHHRHQPDLWFTSHKEAEREAENLRDRMNAAAAAFRAGMSA